MVRGKMGAVLVYGFRVAWSYRINFFTNYLSRFFIVIFYYFFGVLVSQSGLQEFEGGSYFSFILLGGIFLKFLELIMRAFADNIREQLLNGTIEAVISTATPTSLALLGVSSWRLVESTGLLIFQLLLGIALGADFSHANWLSTAVVVLLALVCVLSFGIFAATFTIIFKRAEPIAWLNNALIQFFAGVFFPITLLPPVLRFFSYLFPFSYALQALRGAMIQGKTIAALGPDLLALGGFSVVLLPLSLYTIRVAIRRLKQTGGLILY